MWWTEIGIIGAAFATYLAKEIFNLSTPMYIGLFFLLLIMIFQKM
ncbi:MAG: hypothetical protein PHY80_04660 [Rickettsiales bacterium]|nr:hypothetical protein [Rickettsiales bacterium]